MSKYDWKTHIAPSCCLHVLAPESRTPAALLCSQQPAHCFRTGSHFLLHKQKSDKCCISVWKVEYPPLLLVTNNLWHTSQISPPSLRQPIKKNLNKEDKVVFVSWHLVMKWSSLPCTQNRGRASGGAAGWALVRTVGSSGHTVDRHRLIQGEDVQVSQSK